METPRFERILVPTDMSDFANLALQYAALFRERAGSKLTLLYADELYLPVDLLEAPLGYYLENAPESRENLQNKFGEYAKALIGGSFDTVIVQDAPTRAIVTTAKETSADLVIMGTHGRRGLRRAILGSVTENVLHETEVPVLTVTPALMQVHPSVAIRKILCPINFTRVARASLGHACEVAKLFGAELSVMYVVEGIDAARAPQVEAAFRQWVDPQVRDQCAFNRVFQMEGDPAERVLKASSDLSADLIIIGAQHKFFSDATVIGTTTERITRFARCPVLTVTRPALAEIDETAKERELVGLEM